WPSTPSSSPVRSPTITSPEPPSSPPRPPPRPSERLAHLLLPERMARIRSFLCATTFQLGKQVLLWNHFRNPAPTVRPGANRGFDMNDDPTPHQSTTLHPHAHHRRAP